VSINPKRSYKSNENNKQTGEKPKMNKNPINLKTQANPKQASKTQDSNNTSSIKSRIYSGLM
jgi:hypothetical protein